MMLQPPPTQHTVNDHLYHVHSLYDNECINLKPNNHILHIYIYIQSISCNFFKLTNITGTKAHMPGLVKMTPGCDNETESTYYRYIYMHA